MRYLLTVLAICLILPSIGCRSASWWPWRTASNPAADNSPLATTQPDITLPSQTATASTGSGASGGTAPAASYPVAQTSGTSAPNYSGTAPAYDSTAPAHTQPTQPVATAAPGAQNGPYDVNAYGGAATTGGGYASTEAAAPAPRYTPPAHATSGGAAPPAYEPQMPAYQTTPVANNSAPSYSPPGGDRYASNPATSSPAAGYQAGSRYDGQAPADATTSMPATNPGPANSAPAYAPVNNAPAETTPVAQNPPPAYQATPPSTDRYAAPGASSYAPASQPEASRYEPVQSADSRNAYGGSTSSPTTSPAPTTPTNLPPQNQQPGNFRPGGTGDYIPPVRSGSSSSATGAVIPADYQAPTDIQMPVSTDADASAYHGTIVR